jgi:hypothetical protein
MEMKIGESLAEQFKAAMDSEIDPTMIFLEGGTVEFEGEEIAFIALKQCGETVRFMSPDILRAISEGLAKAANEWEKGTLGSLGPYKKPLGCDCK